MAKQCAGPVGLILPRMMDHKEFDFYEDLVDPFRDFLRQLDITTQPVQGDDPVFKFPEYLYIPPQAQIEHENQVKKSGGQSSLWYWVLRQFK